MFARTKNAPLKEKFKLQGLNWCEHEQTWVLIYFSTSWCAPCKSMTLIMDDVSEHYEDHLRVIKIDVDEQTQLARQLEVTGVPTLVLVDQSGIQSRLVGGVNAGDINQWLSEQLSP